MAPLMEMMRATVVCPALPNPFRCVRAGRAADAFVLAVCGAQPPPNDDELPGIHAQERIAALERLAKLNDQDNATAVAGKLRALRAQLLEGRVAIPPDVTHGGMERWARGAGPKMW